MTVDEKLCFSSPKVTLPAGNSFGITAATPENPDSFEIFRFILRTTEPGTMPIQNQQVPNQHQQPLPNQNQASNGMPSDNRAASANQLVDLTSRVQLISHATNNIIRDLGSQSSKSDARHAELLQRLPTRDQVSALDARLQRMEQAMQNLQRDLAGQDYRDRFNQLQDTLRSSHVSLSESLHGSVLSGMSPLSTSSPRWVYLGI